MHVSASVFSVSNASSIVIKDGQIKLSSFYHTVAYSPKRHTTYKYWPQNLGILFYTCLVGHYEHDTSQESTPFAKGVISESA